MEKMKITKAVIPAAGLGTRFLPWTKSMPKEMLPIVDKPVIQYVVEECVASGINEIIIVINESKTAIENYFQPNSILEKELKKQGKTNVLKQIKKITQLAKFIFIRQTGPYGNAQPVLAAKKVIGDQPFAVLFGDQFVWAKPPRLLQCLNVFNQYQSSVIAGIKVDKEEMRNRGMCDIETFQKSVYKLKKIIEKPEPQNSPSQISAYGTYILTPDIFPILENLKLGKNNELWLVDAINQLCQKRQVLVAELINAKLYDAGNKLNYHRTVVDFMLKDLEIGEKMKQYLKEVI